MRVGLAKYFFPFFVLWIRKLENNTEIRIFCLYRHWWGGRRGRVGAVDSKYTIHPVSRRRAVPGAVPLQRDPVGSSDAVALRVSTRFEWYVKKTNKMKSGLKKESKHRGGAKKSKYSINFFKENWGYGKVLNLNFNNMQRLLYYVKYFINITNLIM